MRHFIYAAAGLAFMLASCDTIDKDDRYIYVEPPQVDLPSDDDDDEADITEARRGVLIEDFTGQLCLNCPKAVAVIEPLTEAYPGLVTVVGIHPSGSNLTIGPEYGGLSTTVGKEYYDAVGSPAMPAGRINRKGSAEHFTTWTTQVMDILRTDAYAPVWFKLNNVYDSEARKVNIELRTKGLDNVSGNLQLWLVEDGIIAYQLMPDGSGNLEYEHKHVFRAAVNGTWGVPFSVSKDEIKSVTSEATLDSAWKAENMSVVAILYNENGVQQVVKAPVVKSQPEEDGGAAEAE